MFRQWRHSDGLGGGAAGGGSPPVRRAAPPPGRLGARLSRLKQLERLVLLWVAGCIALGGATWAAFQLGLNFATASSIFLIVIVLLSLMDSLISSVIFSVVAIICLNYFFVSPLFTFDVARAEDLAGLLAFLICSMAITSLVRRLRDSAEVQREQARLLELTNDAVVVRDMAGVIEYWNPGAERLYGWSRAEAVGKVAHDLLRTVFPSPYTEIDAALLRLGRWEGELVDTTRDGAEVHVAARWSLQVDERGSPHGVLASNTDITKRKQAEDTLRRSQAAYLEEAQKLSRTGSFGWNVSSGEIFWSAETFRIFDCDPAERPSLETVFRRVHPDDAARLRQLLDDASVDGRGFDVEHRLLMPDGSVKHLRAVASAASNGTGDLRYIGAVFDITESKEAYAALERSERRYRSVFQHMPIGLVQVDSRSVVAMFEDLRRQGVVDLNAYIEEHPDFIRRTLDASIIEAVNEQTVRMFGASGAAEMLGPITRLWEQSFGTIQRMMVRRFGGELLFEEETKVVTMDGRVIDVLFSVARTDALAGKSIVGFIDITARVRAQEMLNRVQADFAHAARVSVLGELMASLAHEVNQPLAAIAANGEAGLRWLAQPRPDLSDLRELTESITADARRAADIIGRIRSMAAGKATEKTLLSLDEIIREALLFLRHEVQSRSVTVLHHGSAEAPQVIGDRTQLQQVIVNLTVNSMQAMMESPVRKISIRTFAPDPATVHCTIEDSGPGIRPEHLSRLFDSFFTTKEGGMGMGLPICQSIIEAHGGSITADSDAASGGARFSFALPSAGGQLH